MQENHDRLGAILLRLGYANESDKGSIQRKGEIERAA